MRSLTAEELAPVVRRAIGIEDAWPTRWTSWPLSAALVNPVTLGVFRLEGQAHVPGQPATPWTVVLKVVSDVDFAGTGLGEGYSQQPGDWNYWNREALVYRSGFLDRFRGPLVPVRCLACVEVDVDQTWLWLEALDGALPRHRWSLGELAQAAHDLGAFSAQALSSVDEVESFSWAARRWLRGWVRSIDAIGAGHAREHAGCWQHPQVKKSLPPSARARFVDLMTDVDRLLNLHESLPRTVAHHDTQWSNLFRMQTRGDAASTVAIDWSFLGSAPVGHDLATHLSGNICNRAIDPFESAEHDASSTEAYLQGLHDFGWSGDERHVLFARAASVSLQMCTFFAAHLAWLCPDASEDEPHDDRPPWTEELAETENIDIDEAISGWSAGFDYVLDLGDEARRLANGLE